ncbi:MAG: hypothetical protein Faunusvirus14_11 [Faunusvirus sp.]|jgi:elongation factor 1-gamma|uniref:Elongation factor 1-gamma n=1 Tax=Faunusvirus sp. TaxID=2487766 RepID=A0A3G4ZYP3_9VIRU|nr:MAG: hypothetical protein Faunusvirus14_11 [Faunusvirus sp.]
MSLTLSLQKKHAKFTSSTVGIFELLADMNDLELTVTKCHTTSSYCIYNGNIDAKYNTETLMPLILLKHKIDDSLVMTQFDNYLELRSNLGRTGDIWFGNVFGYIPRNRTQFIENKEHTAKLLSALDALVKDRTYIIDVSYPVMDLLLVGTLLNLFLFAYDTKFLKNYPNVVKWFTTHSTNPLVTDYFGYITPAMFCKIEYKPVDQADIDKQMPKGLTDKKAKVEQAKKAKAEPKKSEPAKKSKDDDLDDETVAEPKKRSVLDALPPSKMPFDTLKKLFYQMRLEGKTCFDEYWKEFDAEGYSVYRSAYNYNDENFNKPDFIVKNTVNGFIQALDGARKYSFGVINLTTKDEQKYSITGYWIFRGQTVPTELEDFINVNTWTKLDHTNATDRAAVQNSFDDPVVDNSPVVLKVFLS